MDSILFLRITELYEDHHPNMFVRPFMPDTAVIDNGGLSACPTRFQDDRREPSRPPIWALRDKTIVWLLDATSIMSTKIADSCSSVLIPLSEKAT